MHGSLLRCAENVSLNSFACDNNSFTGVTFSMEHKTIKVVDNLSIFIFLKFHDFILSGLGAMKF